MNGRYIRALRRLKRLREEQRVTKQVGAEEEVMEEEEEEKEEEEEVVVAVEEEDVGRPGLQSGDYELHLQQGIPPSPPQTYTHHTHTHTHTQRTPRESVYRNALPRESVFPRISTSL